MNKRLFRLPNITDTEAASAIPEFWAQIALGALKANTVMARLVNRDYDNEVASLGDTIHINRRGGLVVNDKAPNTPTTVQNPANTKNSIVLNKHKEITWVIEDSTSAKAIQDAIDYVTDAGVAMAEQIETDLLKLHTLAGFDVGTAGTNLSVDTVLAARERLNKNKCPGMGRVFVVSPKDDTALLKLEQFTNSQWLQENGTALREGYLGRKYGFDFVMAQLVDQVAGTPVTTHNLAFHRDALVLATRPLPLPPADSGVFATVLTVDGVSVRLTRSYDHSALATRWTLDLLYGVGSNRADTHLVDAMS